MVQLDIAAALRLRLNLETSIMMLTYTLHYNDADVHTPNHIDDAVLHLYAHLHALPTLAP